MISPNTERAIRGRTISMVEADNNGSRGIVRLYFTDGSVFEVTSDQDGYGGETRLEIELKEFDGRVVQEVGG